MKTKARIGSLVASLAVGIGTIALFQNCSAGNLPSDLSTSSANAPLAIAAELRIFPAASSVVAGQTVLLTVTGGTGNYTFTPVGMVSTDPLVGYLFTAPGNAGSYDVTVRDDAGKSAFTTIVVNAAPAPAPPTPTPVNPVTAVSKPIYRYWNPISTQHLHSDNPSLPNVGNNEGPLYLLMTDGTSGAVPYYRCALYHNDGIYPVIFYFNTTAADCGGYNVPPQVIGYIYPDASHPNTTPLYRWRLNFQSAYGGRDGRLGRSPGFDQPAATRGLLGERGRDGLRSAQLGPPGPSFGGQGTDLNLIGRT